MKRYKHQLLYGCDDPGCQTATCASRRRRVSEGPYRRYTELSARIIACHLASSDDAEKGLCVNRPYTSEVTLVTLDNRQRTSLRRSRRTGPQATTVATTAGPGSPRQIDRSQDSNQTATAAAESSEQDFHFDGPRSTGPATSPSGPPGKYCWQGLDHAAEQPLKDPKSLPQNLFDTLSLRLVEWLPLRRAPGPHHATPDSQAAPPESECSKNKPEHLPQRQETNQLSQQQHGSAILHAQNSQEPHPRTPSSRTSETQSSEIELKLEDEQVNRLSFAEVDQWRQASRTDVDERRRREDYKGRKRSVNSNLHSNEFTSLPSPPALKHRAHKHRGRTAGPETCPETEDPGPEEQPKNQRRVSWDSGKVLIESSRDESAYINNRRLPLPQSPGDHDSPTYRRSKRSSPNPTPTAAPIAQTVTHLTPEIIGGLGQILVESEEDALKWREELDQIQAMGSFDDPNWRFATSRQRQAFPFIAQSVFFVFSSARQILRSFRKERTGLDTPMLAPKAYHLDLGNLRQSLQHLFAICPWDIALHSLWTALGKLFVPPEDFTTSSRSSRRPSHRSSRSSTLASSPATPLVVRRTPESIADEHLSDADAAYVATVALFALVSTVPELDSRTWREILRMRAAGTVASADMQKLPPEQAQRAVEATDKLEHELGLRLVNRLVRALTARLAYHDISKTRQVYSLDVPNQRRVNVIDRIVDNLSEHYDLQGSGSDKSSPITNPAPLIIEWLRTLFLREWDNNPEMARSSAAGGAVQIMALMYKERNRIGLFPEDFHTPLLAERLDPLEMPVAWLESLPNNRTMHLLSYPFLFPPSLLVIYFRALNHSAMSKYYEAAVTTNRHVTQTAFGSIPVTDEAALLARMKVSMSTFLVLVVRRDNVLTDALNQLWRREKRELMRPLKVQMGMDEGEEGLDHGGVQQEFFRVLMAEALDPSYGMFTMDHRHRISWFRPCSLEPLYKFEFLGLLMSIAIYNGLTLPINFPIAFYRKLLGLKVKHLDHIRDGWPELTQGLETLLSWQEGDVSDVFMRTYEFSFENFGRVESIDMQKVGRDAAWPIPSKSFDANSVEAAAMWSDAPPYSRPATVSPPSSTVAEVADLSPGTSVSGETSKSRTESLALQSPTPPSDEAPLVTNDNRHRFVKDYIFWLTDKSIRPQFEAFLRGFFTCLDRAALSIFTPEALKTVVEGLQEIDMKELENHARYEGGFGRDHRVIQDFWSVVHQYPPKKKAQLLEFVTASDRVPVNGISSIMFVIQKNGVGDLVRDCPLQRSNSVQMLTLYRIIAPAEQLDMFWPPAAAGVYLQAGAGGEAGQSIGKCSGIRLCINGFISALLFLLRKRVLHTHSVVLYLHRNPKHDGHTCVSAVSEGGLYTGTSIPA